jgi:hypothetical protein
VRAVRVCLTAEHVIAEDPVAAAVREVTPREVRKVLDYGDYLSYKLPSGHWVHADVPAVARNLDAFYTGRDTAVPVVFVIEVPDEAETAVAA